VYTLKKDENGLRFQRSTTLLWFAWPMRMIGFLLLPAALALLIDSSQDIIVILGGVGLFLFAGSFLMTAYWRSLPDAFFFNTRTTELEVQGKTGAEARIPFREIARVLVRRDRRQYVLYVERSGGSRLDLTSSHSLVRVRQYLELLEPALKSGSAPVAIATESGPLQWVEKQQLQGSTILSWQDRLSVMATIWIVMLLSGASLMIYGSVRAPGSMIALIVLCLLGIFLLYAAVSLIRSLLCRPGIEIASDRAGSVFLWRRSGSIALRKAATFPLAELHALHCHFEPGRGVQKILLLREEDVRDLEKITVQLSSIFQLLRLHRRIFQIPLHGLSLTGALELETLLRQQVRPRNEL